MAADSSYLTVTAGRSRSASPAYPASQASAPRLPWWALALPALAFAALLAVVALGGHNASAATPPLTDLVAHLRPLLPHGLATGR